MIRNRRLYRRVRLDVGFEVDGAARDLFDLSMGGFAAAPGAPLERDKTVTVSLRLAIDGVDIRTRLRARVIYANAVRCGGRFVDLTASQTAFLRYVVTRRGEPAGALGTTTLLNAIDQPGRPERSSAPQPADEPARKAPWWSRWLGRLRGKRNPIQ